MRTAQQIDLADAVDDHVAVAEVGKVTRAHRHAVGHIRDGITQILHLAFQFLGVHVDEHKLVGNALQSEGRRDMRADMTETDDTADSFLHNIFLSEITLGILSLAITIRL